MKIKTSTKIFLIPAILFAIFFCGKALAAATYYVSPTGNDSYDGSLNAPFKTIQKAANVVNPGDTVYVRGGTYNERVVLTTSGTTGNYITFQNYFGETAILDGTGLGNGIMFKGYNVSYIKIIGLKVRNHVGAGIMFRPSVSNGFSGSHIEIRNNEIYNQTFLSVYGHSIIVVAWPWGSNNTYTDIIIDGNYIHDVITGTDTGLNEALTVAGDVDRFQITNNIIDNSKYIGIDLIGKVAPMGRDLQWPRNGIIANNEVMNSGNGKSAQANIYIDGAKNVTIENNYVHDNAGHGIIASTEQTGFVTENIIIRRNKVWNNLYGISIGAPESSDSPPGGLGNHIRAIHNTLVITQSGKQSSFALYRGDDKIVKNNISYQPSGVTPYHISQYQVLSAEFDTSFDHNCYYPSDKYWYYKLIFYSPFSNWQAQSQDANSIATDPKFTNISTNDFTLQSDSPAIDAGDYLTRTTSAGSGTVITVSDARYFHDGYGISGVSGDTIRVGSNTVTVTGVNYSTNTITVNRSITWNNGDGVSYPYSGSAPDIGAYEYAGAQSDTAPPAAPTGLEVQ